MIRLCELASQSVKCYYERAEKGLPPRPGSNRNAFRRSELANLTPIELARFWSRIQSAPDFHCWEWQGRKAPAGYGRFGAMMAHRVAYELIKGPIPEGLLIRHKCDNPPCCNPRHLIIGTHKQNTQDAVERGRHAVGARSGMAKLSEDQARYILRNAEKKTVRQLAAMFGVAPSTVSMVRSGQRWAHLA